jgi:hypothetical protein
MNLPSIYLRSVSRRLGTIAVLTSTLAVTPVLAQQSLDNFTFHGSLTAAYAKSDGLGVFGIPKDGTFDYRALALQFGYKFDANDRVVVQLLHRAVGKSPLQPLMPELYPVYAFYERKAAGFTIKLGRNPLPRGIFNEVRFIGTLLPLFRVAINQETLENIDGVTVARSFELGKNWGLDATVVGGQSDIKYFIPQATAAIVGKTRAENSLGAQVWLRTPLKGLRLGGFANRFDVRAEGAVPPSPPQFMQLLSVDGDFSKGFVRAEFQKITAGRDAKRSSYANWYAQAGVKPTEQFTLLAEFNQFKTLLQFPAPLAALDLNLQNDIAVAVNFAPSSNVKYKFELHSTDGYSFDTQVPTVIPPTKPPFVMTPAPRSKAVYGILSISVSF